MLEVAPSVAVVHGVQWRCKVVLDAMDAVARHRSSPAVSREQAVRILAALCRESRAGLESIESVLRTIPDTTSPGTGTELLRPVYSITGPRRLSRCRPSRCCYVGTCRCVRVV